MEIVQHMHGMLSDAGPNTSTNRSTNVCSYSGANRSPNCSPNAATDASPNAGTNRSADCGTDAATNACSANVL